MSELRWCSSLDFCPDATDLGREKLVWRGVRVRLGDGEQARIDWRQIKKMDSRTSKTDARGEALGLSSPALPSPSQASQQPLTCH
jgi:hypothetical protein